MQFRTLDILIVKWVMPLALLFAHLRVQRFGNMEDRGIALYQDTVAS